MFFHSFDLLSSKSIDVFFNYINYINRLIKNVMAIKYTTNLIDYLADIGYLIAI